MTPAIFREFHYLLLTSYYFSFGYTLRLSEFLILFFLHLPCSNKKQSPLICNKSCYMFYLFASVTASIASLFTLLYFLKLLSFLKFGNFCMRIFHFNYCLEIFPSITSPSSTKGQKHLLNLF